MRQLCFDHQKIKTKAVTKRKTLKHATQLILTALGTEDVHGKRGKKIIHISYIQNRSASINHLVDLGLKHWST